MKILSRGRGFTLIELLTVIAIIALLASIIIASLQTAQRKSRDAKRVSDIKNLELSLATYYNDHDGSYPATLGGLTPEYLSTLPTDPSSSVTSQTCATSPTTAGCYYYAALGSGDTCTSYHLGATLEQPSSNSALNNDSDSSASSGICTGSDSDFSGADSAGCNSESGEACYDIHS